MKRIAITTGDPSGIGSEITVKALHFYPLRKEFVYIIYGSISEHDNILDVKKINSIKEANKGGRIYHIDISDDSVLGFPSKQSGETAYKILTNCAKDLNSGMLDAVVTSPISKHEIRKSYPDFIGHTEFFAHSSNSNDVIMSFWGESFNVALLTTHLAVKNVSKLLTESFLKTSFRKIFKETSRFIDKPKIAMLAVNPHAGEEGAFGTEDILISSVLHELAQEDIEIDGPFPADTFFAKKVQDYDMIISAFHDQGLIPFKMINQDCGVNVTLGLPFVRTSVDHGTAFDIAGKDIASEESMISAINFAERMLNQNLSELNSNYSSFARHYDTYMEHVEYNKWVNFVLRRYYKDCGKDPEQILELACGTANIATKLVERGFLVDASDIASDMLKVAYKKPFAPKLFLSDMSAPAEKNKYDFVLLLFDSINYLKRKNSIEKLFQNIYNYIKQDGVFIFDISTLQNCRDNFDNFVNIEDQEDFYFIHQGDMDESENFQFSHLTFFEKQGYNFKRRDEIHKQRIYRVQELIDLANKSEFTLTGIYSIDKTKNLLNTNVESLDTPFTRLFFVLKKI